MAENKNMPAIVEEPKTDLSPTQIVKVNEFIEEGMPGIGRIDEVKMSKIIDLYLSGKTYTDISTILRLPKVMILYLSQKFNWYDKRREYLNELELSGKTRVLESKAVTQDHLLRWIHFFETRHSNKINQYLASQDEEITRSIDLKEIDKYLKIVELVHAMNADGKAPKAPMVGLNVGDGMTLKQVGGGVEITPKQKTSAEMLKEYANARRQEEENNKLGKKSDIIIEEPSEIQGENDNEND